MNLREFNPMQTLAALARVREAHPHTADVPGGIDKDFLEALRRKLRAIESRDVTSLANSLKPTEVRGCLYLLARGRERMVLERAAAVIRKRARPDLIRTGWVLLRSHYPSLKLESCLRHLATKVGWERATRDPKKAERFKRWFASESLPVGLLTDFAEIGSSPLESWLEQWEIETRSGLASATWREALCTASAQLIEKIGHAPLLDRAMKAEKAVQNDFAFNYLTKISMSDWLSDAVTWVESHHGKPHRAVEGLTPFWRRFDSETRQAFRRYVVEKTLREFFDSVEDPHGRFQFWRSFLDHVEAAEAFLDRTVAIIDFGDFGVVEFGQVGNAAYVYESERLATVWHHARSASGPGDFKDRRATLRRPHPGPTGDGRMIHHDRWQDRYRPWIRRLLRS